MDPWSPLGIGLIVTAGVTSFITSSLGIGGGVMLLAILAQFLPAQIIVPVHGIVQLGSNLGRAIMSARHIDWALIRAFTPGAVVGAALGSMVLVNLPGAAIYLSIAAFTLLLCWGPPLPTIAAGRAGAAALGVTTTFLTLFVGATGPLVGAFVRQRQIDRFATVSTFAAAMSLQHTLKAIVFQWAGFDLRPWLVLVAAMIAAGMLGTWLGLRVLHRFEDRHFATTFKVMLTLLSVRLIWQAFA